MNISVVRSEREDRSIARILRARAAYYVRMPKSDRYESNFYLEFESDRSCVLILAQALHFTVLHHLLKVLTHFLCLFHIRSLITRRVNSRLHVQSPPLWAN